MVNKIRSCVFISGNGSNLKSIIKSSRDYNFPVTIKLIISNNLRAKGIEFAKKYKLPIRRVIESHWDTKKYEFLKEAYLGKGCLINSPGFEGWDNEKAKIEITKKLSSKKIGKKKQN